MIAYWFLVDSRSKDFMVKQQLILLSQRYYLSLVEKYTLSFPHTFIIVPVLV